MNFIRTHIASKLICLLFGLHMLNISVQRTDAACMRSGPSPNEMESISEIICEQILQMENAFPEYCNHHKSDHGSAVSFHFIPLFFHLDVPGITPVVHTAPLRSFVAESFFSTAGGDIQTPPPKA